MSETTAILLIACQDQKGLVARVSGVIHDYGGNILDSDHHTDRETGDFLMRTVFDLSEFRLACAEIRDVLRPIANIYNMLVQSLLSNIREKDGLFPIYLWASYVLASTGAQI